METCEYDLLAVFTSDINNGDTHYYRYNHDPELKYADARNVQTVERW